MTAFLIIAYWIISLASVGMRAVPSTPLKTGSWLESHKYAMRKLGWGLWPLGFPAFMTLWLLDICVVTPAFHAYGNLDRPAMPLLETKPNPAASDR
jgi:hypothetical protein